MEENRRKVWAWENQEACVFMRVPGGKGQNGQENRKLGIKEKQSVLLPSESLFLNS